MTRSQALVLAGHGSQRHPRSAAPLHAHARRIREGGDFDEVRTAFWKEEPSLRGVASTVESDVAYVVPVLTSEGYFADGVFPRELGVDPESGPGTPELHYTEPVGTHDEMTSVVEARVASAVEGDVGDVGVALVGHGTERNERSALATRSHAARLRRRGRFAEVAALFLDEPPYVGDVYDRLTATRIVVVPLFVADGYHTTEDIPAALGHPGIGETAEIEGRLVHYTGAAGTEPRLADVIVERAIEAGADLGADSAARELSTAGGAFVRWIRATEAVNTWGALSISRGSDGFELRHRADVEEPGDALEAVDDPADLREHVRYDDRGRYRPLSGARSLPTGWVLDGLGPVDLLRAVRSVYPGSVEHWHRERTGELSATHFRETAARQTGIYADVDELDGTGLAAAREAVCGDCVRTPRWRAAADGAGNRNGNGNGNGSRNRDGEGDGNGSRNKDGNENGNGEGDVIPDESGDQDESKERDATSGDGAIPCREACPFFLSAAHAFLEANGDAAAEPNLDVPAGELENPGNRYRVRFARALARREDTTSAPLSARGGR